MDRRRFLRDLGLGAGGTFLAPLVNPWLREAHGQVETLPRLVVFQTSLGSREAYIPRADPDAPLGFSMGAFNALDPLKPRMQVVKNLYNPFNQHLHGNSWALSANLGTGDRNREPGAQTWDRFIADRISADMSFRSLNLSVWDRRRLETKSADGLGRPVPVEVAAAPAFERIFPVGSGEQDANALRRRNLQRRRILDAVRGDVSRLERRLAGPEKRKLDMYLTSINELDDRIARLQEATGQCEAITVPNPDRLGDRSLVTEEHKDAMLDLAGLALACGLTRVAHIYIPTASLEWIPTSDGKSVGSHGMWHGDGTDFKHETWSDLQATSILRVYRALENATEGDGNMADRTLFIWLNGAGGPHHNGSYEYWVMSIGDPNGNLDTGRFIELPESQVENARDPRHAFGTDHRAARVGRDYSDRSTADWLTTLNTALGLPNTPFGHEAIRKGPIEEMLR